MHPQILDTFEAGWTALGTDIQQKWQAFGHRYDPIWKSWTHVAFNHVRNEFIRKQGRQFRTRFLGLDNQELTDMTASNLVPSGSLFGLPDIEGTRDIREEIANVVAEMVVRKETTELIHRLRENIKRDGLDALRKYLLEDK